MTRRAAFYAPMKSPDHPNPSGDRRVARLMMRALDRAGFETRLASELRSHEKTGDPDRQAALAATAEQEAARLIEAFRPAPPALWFTYHCYYKAPDLIGPEIARAFAIPYVIAEGYRARKRLTGPWAGFAARAEAALDTAETIFWLSARSLPALEAYRAPGQRLVHLRPFLALGDEPEPAPLPAEGPLRLCVVAMMRPGDKLASYRAIVAALALAGDLDWTLEIVGDGDARGEVAALFAPFGARVIWAGRLDERRALHGVYERSELLLWPGVNEAFGMVYLEAQATGCPVLAEDRAGVREVVAPASRLAPPDNPAAYAAALREMAADRTALAAAGRAARAHVMARHGIDAAAMTLRAELIARPGAGRPG